MRFFLISIFTLYLSASNAQTQEATSYLNEIKEISKYAKRAPEVINILDKLSISHRDYLDNNCEMKIDHYAKIGLYYYGIDRPTAVRYYEDSVLVLLPQCENAKYDTHVNSLRNLYLSYYFLDIKDERQTEIINELIMLTQENQEGHDAINAKLYAFIGYFYFGVRNEYEQCLIYLRKSIAYFNTVEINSAIGIRPYLYYAGVLYEMDRVAEALEAHKKVYELQKVVYENSTRPDRHMWTNLANIVKACIYLEKYDEAESYLKKINSIEPVLVPFQRKITALGLSARIAYRQKEYTKAYKLMQETIALRKTDLSSPLAYLFSSDIIMMDDILSAMGMHKEAESYLKEGAVFESYGLEFDSDYFDLQNIIVDDEIRFSYTLMRLFGLQCVNDQISETTIIHNALQYDSLHYVILDQLEGEYASNELIKDYHQFAGHIIGYIFNNNLQNKYPDLLAYFITNSKSILLYDDISTRQSLPESLKNKYNELSNRSSSLLSLLEQSIENENQQEIDSLSVLYFDHYKAVRKLRSQLDSIDTGVKSWEYQQDVIENIQKTLNDNQVYMDYYYSDSTIYRFVCTGEKFEFNRFSTPRILIQSNYIEYLTNEEKNTKDLIDPVSPLAESTLITNTTKKLTIVPDGELTNIPFEILEVNDKQIIQSYDVQYLYSFNVSQMIDQADNRGNTYMGFGLEYNNKILNDIENAPRIQRLFRDTFRLATLPNAINEIKNGAKVHAGAVFEEKDCNAKTFYKNVEQASIIHLTNHVLLNENNALLSSIIFSEGDSFELVSILDIKKLNLNSDLAILSSCNSGVGINTKGNGLRSIGQAFYRAGCPAVVVNLWEASDYASTIIIDYFNQNLKVGMDKSSALRKAKLDYIAQASPAYRHPSYWATIVLIGSDESLTIESSMPSSFWYWLLIFGGLLAVGFWLFKKK